MTDQSQSYAQDTKLLSGLRVPAGTRHGTQSATGSSNGGGARESHRTEKAKPFGSGACIAVRYLYRLSRRSVGDGDERGPYWEILFGRVFLHRQIHRPPISACGTDRG